MLILEQYSDMNEPRILRVIEETLIGDSEIRRRPFGLAFIHNISPSMLYFYDLSYRTGFTEFEHLKPIAEQLFVDSIMESWTDPVKYFVEDTKGTVVIKVFDWTHSFQIGSVSCDRLIRVTYVYPSRIKHEFHVRVL